jgi:Xaa-Pro aminopeptidase
LLPHTTIEITNCGEIPELHGQPNQKPHDSKLFLHDEQFHGEMTKSKLTRIGEKLETHFCALIINNQDEICWLLNMRGNDVDYKPYFKSKLILKYEET